MSNDDFIEDKDLLIEAARYAVSQGTRRNAFMSQAKWAWDQADAERRGIDLAALFPRR